MPTGVEPPEACVQADHLDDCRKSMDLLASLAEQHEVTVKCLDLSHRLIHESKALLRDTKIHRFDEP